MSDDDQRIEEDERTIVNYIDLQNRYEEIRDLMDKTNQPVFIERGGKIESVLMTLEYYKQQHFDLFHPIPEFEQTD